MELISKSIAQQIVDTVKDVCNQNINFINEHGIIIASTDPARIQSFHEIGHQVVTTGTTLEVSDNDSFFGTKKGINIPITYNGKIIAAIGISGEVEEVRKYAYLAQRITDILLKERELDAQGTQKNNRLHYVIRCLINGEPVDSVYLSEVLNENGLHESSVCRVVLVRLNSRYNPSNLFMIQTAITQAFSRMESNFYRYNYPNEYILIMAEEAMKKYSYILRKLSETYEGVLHIGIGSAAAVKNSAESYRTARLAINCADIHTPYVVYDDLDFELILGNIPEELKKQYMKKVTGLLGEEEKQLIRTYFELDMSLKDTCEALYIHKNSLQYKLNHIHSLCGYNPRKFRDAVVLYSAVRLENIND